jgi:hypothetical protein
VNEISQTACLKPRYWLRGCSSGAGERFSPVSLENIRSRRIALSCTVVRKPGKGCHRVAGMNWGVEEVCFPVTFVIVQWLVLEAFRTCKTWALTFQSLCCYRNEKQILHWGSVCPSCKDASQFFCVQEVATVTQSWYNWKVLWLPTAHLTPLCEKYCGHNQIAGETTRPSCP